MNIYLGPYYSEIKDSIITTVTRSKKQNPLIYVSLSELNPEIILIIGSKLIKEGATYQTAIIDGKAGRIDGAEQIIAAIKQNLIRIQISPYQALQHSTLNTRLSELLITHKPTDDLEGNRLHAWDQDGYNNWHQIAITSSEIVAYAAVKLTTPKVAFAALLPTEKSEHWRTSFKYTAGPALGLSALEKDQSSNLSDLAVTHFRSKPDPQGQRNIFVCSVKTKQ